MSLGKFDYGRDRTGNNHGSRSAWCQPELGCWFQRQSFVGEVAAPAVKGKANQELIRLSSDLLGLGRDKLSIAKGLTSRNKAMVIRGLERSHLLKLLKRGGTEANRSCCILTKFGMLSLFLAASHQVLELS